MAPGLGVVPRGHRAPSRERRRPVKVRSMPKTNLHLLLINPWIFDFAAHDLWGKPLGLLLLGGLLRARGPIWPSFLPFLDQPCGRRRYDLRPLTWQRSSSTIITPSSRAVGRALV